MRIYHAREVRCLQHNTSLGSIHVKKTALRSVFVLADMLLAAGCSDLASDVVPAVLKPIEPTDHSFALVAKPDSGRIGSIISMRDTHFTCFCWTKAPVSFQMSCRCGSGS